MIMVIIMMKSGTTEWRHVNKLLFFVFGDVLFEIWGSEAYIS